MKAYQLEAGLSFRDVQPFTARTKVIGVDVFEHGVRAYMNDGCSYLFGPSEDVRFPRRPDGTTVVWQVDGDVSGAIPLDAVKLGDVLPPWGGWPAGEDGEPSYRNGHVVRQITYAPSGVRFVVYSPELGKCEQLYVPWKAKDVYGLGSFWAGVHERVNPVPAKNVSGRYKNTHDGRTAVFRLRGVRGRPPLDSAIPPSYPEDWEPWVLQHGETPHPDDPRNPAEDDPLPRDGG